MTRIEASVRSLLACIFPVGPGDEPRKADAYIAGCFLVAARNDALEEASCRLLALCSNDALDAQVRRGITASINELRSLRRET